MTALCIATLLVAGVPAILIALAGWPLPTRIPTPDEVQFVFRSGNPKLVLNVIALFIWFIWLQLIIVLTTETIALLRGKAARRVPVLPGLQTAAARLVATIALIGATITPLRPGVVIAQPPAIAAPFTVPSYITAPPAEVFEPASGPHQVEGGLTYEVQRYDTLWSIAEKTLGDGRRWHEISNLNSGHTGSGRLVPGATLDLPSDADLDTPPPQIDVRPFPREFTVKPGDNFWKLTKQSLTNAWGREPTNDEIRPRWKNMIAINMDRLRYPGDPDRIFPGQEFLEPDPGPDPTAQDTHETWPPEPETGVDEPIVEPPVAPVGEHEPERPDLTISTTIPMPETTTTTGDAANPTPTPKDDDRTDASPDDDTEWQLLPVAAWSAGLGLLAAGLVALLDRLRRGQLRHRRPGTVPVQPRPDSAPVETMLRAAAAPSAARFIDTALRALCHHPAAAPHAVPELVTLELDDAALTVHLAHPLPHPPPPWQTEDNGNSWTLSTRTDETRLRREAEGKPAPYPALITLGQVDQTLLLLNLETAGSIQVVGTPDDMLSFCRTVAVELATSQLADHLDIVCVGFGSDLAHFERIHAVERMVDVASDIAARTTVVSQSGFPSAAAGRLQPGEADGWNPIIVIDPNTTAPEDSAILLEGLGGDGPICAVAGYPLESQWKVHSAGDVALIEPLARIVTRHNLTENEASVVSDLLAAAGDDSGIEVLSAPAQQGQGLQPSKVALMADSAVEIQILGKLYLPGIDRWPLRKSVEILTYLAFNRKGVKADVLMEAIWPNEPPDYARLNRHASRTRTTLGEGPDGLPYLSHVTRGLYTVSPHLTTDLDRLESHLAAADMSDGPEQIAHLRAGLALVSGPPFTDVENGYSWAYTEGIVTRAVITVDNTAHTLSEIALESGDHDLVTWASRKGLLSAPGCEECYRNLMRSAITQNNRIALDAIYNELLATVDADDLADAVTYLDTETLEMFASYTQRASRTRNPESGKAIPPTP